VQSIRRHPTHVDVSTDRGTETFDHVVIAAHSNQALSMLADPTPEERRTLGAIRYQPNETVLHTDERLLPRNPRARASWNYLVPEEPSSKVNVTYYSNLLQSIASPEHYLVSLNRTSQVRERDIIRTMTFDHPVYTFAGLEAQKGHEELNGKNRTSFCGAYWGYGFHEDGVQSALAATRPFGVSL
jgi:predicted NAD/FAD-binding protein